MRKLTKEDLETLVTESRRAQQQFRDYLNGKITIDQLAAFCTDENIPLVDIRSDLRYAKYPRAGIEKLAIRIRDLKRKLQRQRKRRS